MGIIDHPVLLFALLLVVLLGVVEIGFRLGLRAAATGDEKFHEQIVGARNGIVTLLSLLLGFMLPMSLTRFDQRRHFAIEEAKAIGTTSLRAQMLPEPARSKSHDLMREYVDARLKFFEAGLHAEKLQAADLGAKQLQNELWKQSVAAAQLSPTPITALFAQSLNQMIDLSEERLAALENRIPSSIWLMLVLISLLTCLTVGCSLRRRFVLSMLVTPLMIAIVMALIADLDSPRSGLIRIDQQSMQRVQSDIKAAP
ncbi:MAG: hypothetical protein HYR58_00380 [Acidobacteria bacterium]|nr:hypothetical protein [Acidobacteriota bacterium]